jgi:hypothetical protein
MLFYKYQCSLEEDSQEEGLADRTQEYLAKCGERAQLFLVRTAPGHCTLVGALQPDATAGWDREAPARNFLGGISMPGTVSSCEEVTGQEFALLMRTSERNGFLPDDCALKTTFRQGRRYSPFEELETVERLCSPGLSKRRAAALAGQMCLGEALAGEIGRIYQSAPAALAVGHPVHYLVRAASFERCEKLVDLLVAMLYQNHRVLSRRYAILSADGEPDGEALEQVYGKARGGTIALRFAPKDGEDDAPGAADAVLRILGKYAQSVLTILCFSGGDERTMARVGQVPGVAFVRLEESQLPSGAARAHLMRLARARGVPHAEGLIAGLPAQGGLTANQLDEYFECWYGGYLRRRAFPQYAAFIPG